jgi:hypothetical protein
LDALEIGDALVELAPLEDVGAGDVERALGDATAWAPTIGRDRSRASSA